MIRCFVSILESKSKKPNKKNTEFKIKVTTGLSRGMQGKRNIPKRQITEQTAGLTFPTGIVHDPLQSR